MTIVVDLVDEYVALQSKLSQLEEEKQALEQRIGNYAKENNLKTLKTPEHLLYVIQKQKSVFPQKDDPRRKELESIVAKAGEKEKFESLDVVRLATAYDEKKLSPELREALKKLVEKKPYLKITLLPVKEKVR